MHSHPAIFRAVRHTAAALRAGRLLAVLLAGAAAPALAWEPSAPVELVVPAGTGGGADQMARFIQKAVTDHQLMTLTAADMPE